MKHSAGRRNACMTSFPKEAQHPETKRRPTAYECLHMPASVACSTGNVDSVNDCKLLGGPRIAN
jgi:hypothetical protein